MVNERKSYLVAAPSTAHCGESRGTARIKCTKASTLAQGKTGFWHSIERAVCYRRSHTMLAALWKTGKFDVGHGGQECRTQLPNVRESGIYVQMKPIRSRVLYFYRDSANYKYWSEYCLNGCPDLAQIRKHLLHGEYFVPRKVGLPALTPQCMNSDDHELHEIDSVEIISDGAGEAEMPAEEFLARIKRANHQGWFS